MSIMSSGGPVHAHAPELVQELLSLNEVAEATCSGPEMDLCKLRMRQMHGADLGEAAPDGVSPEKAAALSEWWESDLFSDHERACLHLTEQFVLAVSAVRQEDIDALMPTWSDDEIYDFVMALYVADMSSRADLVLASVFDDAALSTRPQGD
ncbi:carboxymuconolactone decarboxylase family protein [Nocardioides houyundeii]|uniref:carboxymuconolactone decarboxylase family protein n=1 Tax=Nocardioides houyundeii TaxID=2045452 RepID=UPI00131597A2|nr:hypothetical protein [Nocardioides houyundeii]